MPVLSNCQKMGKLTPEQRSKIMRAIKSKNTKSEMLLAKALWHRGYRYRKHDKSIFGTPDLTFKKLKIAIFIDSEFFHGKDFETKKKPVNNAEFWEKKIKRNIERDQQVNEYLTTHGWTVLRFWSEDIKKNLHKVTRSIENTIEEKRNLINYKTKPIQLPSGNYLQPDDIPQAAEPTPNHDE
jgi:DNA mismatch endonuclease (patch repair protein)